MLFKNYFAVTATVFLISCGSLIPSGHQNPLISEWRAGEYKLDPDHASLLFSLNHLGFSDYYGRFNALEATLDFNPESPADSKLFAKVSIESLDVNNPAFEKELLSDDWFDAEHYPEAYLESIEIIPLGEQKAQLIGKLTLKGITNDIIMDVTYNGGAVNLLTGKYTLGFSAKGVIKRSDYNLSSLVPAIGDEVNIQISAEFLRED